MSYNKMQGKGGGLSRQFAEKSKQLAEKKKAESEIPYEDDIVQAEKVGGLSFQARLEAIESHVKDHRKGKDKYPESVLAVYDLVKALNSYQGELSAKNNLAREQMVLGLTKQIENFITKLPPSRVFGSRDFDPRDHDQIAARDLFQRNCGVVINNNYKDLATATTMWNAIKDVFNEACKAIGLQPKGKVFDTRLDSSEILQARGVKEKFNQVKTSGDVQIKDEDDIDYKGPSM